LDLSEQETEELGFGNLVLVDLGQGTMGQMGEEPANSMKHDWADRMGPRLTDPME